MFRTAAASKNSWERIVAVDSALKSVDEQGGRGHLDGDNGHIQAENSAGISTGPLNGDINVVKEADDHAKELQPKVQSPFRDKGIRRPGKP